MAFETRRAKRASSNNRNGIAAGALVRTTSQKLVNAPIQSSLVRGRARSAFLRMFSTIRR